MDNKTLLVTDLDGTLWFDGETCHPKSLEAFRTIQDRNIPILVATGRRLRIVADSFKQFGWRVPCLLLNGSLCYDFNRNYNLFSVPFSQEASTSILEIFESHDLSPTVYADDSYVYANEPTTSSGHIEAIGTDLIQTQNLNVYKQGLNALNFCILGLQKTELNNVVSELRSTGFGNPSFYIDRLFGGYSLTVQPPEVSKWSGIMQWCTTVGFKPSRIVTIGDAGNDLEMLSNADTAIVVKGAEQRLLDLSDHTIDIPEVGGWAQIPELL
ncbi:MAG: HAD hydrolase family protein [Acidimicrobiales bacterium]|nr:HAD hydrolase family protein [Acidimicrobiales bacterium]MDP6299156.1 HAD hydrolase family protein [Acidimicrobiales bacterium]HJM29440.1 HAD hydrolase family protein [Acidimicrobiales bacterium]HJM98501.1 HAD hydrolase family protein [Acidimicrobiales bacterium]